MSESIDEQLLGYLLGALDDDESENVENRLAANPRLQAGLARLQARLGTLARPGRMEDPPVGLAERTCRFVFGTVDELDEADDELTQPAGRSLAEAPPLAPVSEPAPEPVGLSARMGWLDLAVAATVFLTATFLLAPAIQKSRFDARQAQCQNNLRQLGMALADYSDTNQGYFPEIPVAGHLAAAGVYAPKLLEEGYVTTPNTFFCAGSPLAQSGDLQIPKLKDVLSASGPKLARLQRTMGGSYGYSLGYLDHGTYRPVRNQRRPTFAIVADRPSIERPDFQSMNHDGLGQNVLFEDGHAAFVATPCLAGWSDNVYLNDAGQLAPGIHADDSVVGPSEVNPVTGLMPLVY